MEQMSHRWAEGVGPTAENALSGRTAALADGDKLFISIPWIHHDYELIGEADVSKLDHAVAKVKALVAPPAPSE